MRFSIFSKQEILNISQLILRCGLLSFKLEMWCTTCFFQGKRNEFCRELIVVHGHLTLFLLSSAITAFQAKILTLWSKVLWRIVKVPLKGLLYRGIGKCSASSEFVEFYWWPLEDFTLTVNRTSGRKMKNLVEIV